VLLLFSSIAVTLTAVGLYGLTSFVVVQRRREVGIRLALGAESRQIVGLFLRRGMAPVLAGGATGLFIALAGTRVLASVLHGVGPTDPTAFVAAIAGFTLVALAAILVATRRAPGMDPLTALRTE
jgi:ABC-type antimicrobial peptide transport system permease subunit